jgi:hypothetical protein
LKDMDAWLVTLNKAMEVWMWRRLNNYLLRSLLACKYFTSCLMDVRLKRDPRAVHQSR